MSTSKKTCTLALAAALAAVALVGAGCASAVAAEAPAPPHDAFSTRMDGDEGIVVELEGYAHGHRAGEQASFELTLRNGSEDVWQSHYCLVLVDRSGPVATFASQELSLQPGASEGRTVEAQLPESLADGCYSLAFVLPERLASMTTITVGDGDGPCTGPWPTPACP